MNSIGFIYEIIGLIIAASLLAFLTKPYESELSRASIVRHRKKHKKKSRYETRLTEPPMRDPMAARQDVQSGPIAETPADLSTSGQIKH
jgi:hypothetical protein